jgi:putative endonuclease
MRERDNRSYGSRGESAAAAYLETRGFEILERNYRYGKSGEIDLIARKDTLLLFVEVKSRRGDRYGGPLYSIPARKKKTLRHIASAYLHSHPQYSSRDYTCRFDMISLADGTMDWVEDIIR